MPSKMNEKRQALYHQKKFWKLDWRDALKTPKTKQEMRKEKSKIKRVWDYSAAVLATFVTVKIALELWGKSVFHLEFHSQFLGIDPN